MSLTDTRLRALRPTGSRFELSDRDGLVLRVSQRGVMTWAVSFRIQGSGLNLGASGKPLSGKKKRFTIGEYPTISLSEAREQATAVKRLARAGIVPAESLRPAPKVVPTVGALIDRYASQHLRRNLKSGTNIEKLLNLHVRPWWGERELAEIRRSDFIELLEIVRLPMEVEVVGLAGTYMASRGGPGAAAEVRKWTQAMFQFAVDAQMVAESPLIQVRNRDRQQARTRVLSMNELRTVWHAASQLEHPWGPFFQLLLLTGARRGEWANAHTTWLDPNRTRVEIPADAYKTGKAQVLPLSRPAQAVVKQLPLPENGPYLFSSTNGAQPISGFSKAKQRLDNILASGQDPVASWVAHDLRRSMATHMERIGIAPHIIEVCLGHTLKGVAATYRHYTYLSEKTAALQHWADELLLLPAPTG